MIFPPSLPRLTHVRLALAVAFVLVLTLLIDRARAALGPGILVTTLAGLSLVVAWARRRASSAGRARATTAGADGAAGQPEPPPDQQWLQAILNLMPMPLLLIEQGTARVVFANRAADQLAGGVFPRDVPADAYHTVYVCTDARGQRIPDAEMPGVRAARGERLNGFQMTWHTPGGARELIVFSEPLPALHGHQPLAIVVFQDVTALKRVELASTRLGKLIDESANEIYIFDAATLHFVQVNAGARYNLGYSMEELHRLTPLDLKPAFTRESFESLIAPLRTGDAEHIVFETVHRRKDGSEYPVEVRLQLSRAEERPVFVAMILDTTERRAAEAALRRSEERYRTLFETMSQGVVYHDATGAITGANPAALRILGLTLEQLQGRTSMDPRWQAINPDGSPFPGAEHPAMVALRTGREVRDVVMGIAIPGEAEHRWISINATPQFRPGETTPYQVYAIFEDITARYRSEAALRESEQRFRTMADSAPVLLWIAAPDGRCTFFNQQWLAFTGRTLEEELGDGWFTGVHPDDRAANKHMFHEAVERRAPFQMEYRLRRADGEYRWIYDSGAPLVTPDGRLAGYIGSAVDITERKRDEEAIVRSEERYRSIFELVPVSIWEEDWSAVIAMLRDLRRAGVTDLARYCEQHPEWVNQALAAVKILDVNEATVTMFHATAKEDLLGSLQTVFATPDTLTGFVSELIALSAGQQLFETEMLLRTVTGAPIHVLLRMIFPPPESPSGMVLVSLMDITARKRVEAALRESEGRFRTMADSAPVLLWVSDVDGACTFFNQPWLRFTGRTLEQELGYGWTEQLHPDDVEQCLQTYRTNFAARRRFETECRLRRADGEYRWMLTTGTPRFTPDGTFEGFIGSCVDITDRKRAEERLMRLHQITAALSEAVSVETVMEVVIDQGVAAMGASAASIALLEEESWLRLARTAGYAPALIEAWQRFPLAAPTPIAEATRTGQPVWIESPAAYADRYPDIVELSRQSGSRSLAAIPLQVEGRTIGALGLSFATPQAFKEADRAFMAALARQCAQALARARLYDAERRARSEAQTAAATAHLRAEQLSGLAAAALAINAAFSLDEALQTVTHQARALIGAHQGVSSFTVNNNWAQAITAVSLSDKYARWRTYDVQPDGSGIYAEVCRTNRPMRLTQAELESHPLWRGFGAHAAEHPPLQGWLAAPFVGRDGRNIGLLQLSDKYEGEFTAEDEAILVQLAQMASVAIENARLYREAQESARAANEARALLDTLFATAPVGLAFFDTDLRYVRLNDALAEINGVPVAQHLGRTVQQILPRLSEEVMVDLQRVLHTGQPIVEREVVGETPAAPGKQRYWLANYYQVPSDNGAPLGVGAVVQEITERKRAEERQRFLAEASALLVSSLDYTQTLQHVAQLVVPRLADWCVIDLLEDDTLKRIAVVHRDPARVALAEELRQRFPIDRDAPYGVAAVIRTGRSELLPVISDDVLAHAASNNQELLELLRGLGLRSSMVVPLVAGGRIFGAMTFVSAESQRTFDAADLQLAEDLARRAAVAVDNARLYHAAQQAILARDEFLSIASHELRTPLTSLQLQSQSLLRMLQRSTSAVAPDKLIGKLQLIERQTRRLTQLTDNLLDVSRIRLGRFDLRVEPVDLTQLARDLVARFEEQLREADCVVHIVAEEPVMLATDRSRVEQITTNLLSNAIKYGAGKPIEIVVERDDSYARLHVRDQGIGIAPDHLERIFVRFERAVSSQNYGGLGLGLYIVRQLVEALGGAIRVRSELGAGSTFTVSLPLAHRRD